VKIFHLIALLLAIGGGLIRAQTNTNAVPQPVRTQTVITSESGFFSNVERKIIYTGNVRVDDPQMKLTCEQLTADFPQTGGHIDHMVAVTNVVMDSVDEKGQTNHATSDKAIYDYKLENGATNEIITLTGHARAENSQIILYGEPITYYRATGSLTATNQHMIIKQNLSSALMNTNAVAAKTNSPPATIIQNTHQTNNAPVIKTNFPPAAIQSTNVPVIKLPVTKTNLPPARIQNLNQKAPRNL
jgi:lipopolysaccharide transport protein LptA